jgi:hypothetical protein
METLMAGAASIEIFLASVGIAMVLGRLALQGVFWMMQDAGTQSFRKTTTPRQGAVQPQAAIGSLAMVRIRVDRNLPLRAR